MMSSSALQGTTTTTHHFIDNGDSTQNTSNYSPPKGIQWEVPLVDDYLFSLLIPSLQRAIGSLTGQRKSPLSSRSLLALLSAFTIFMTRGQTPATQALGWKLVEIPQKAAAVGQSALAKQPILHPPPSRSSIVFYILCSVLLPTLYQKFQDRYHEYLLINQINNNRNVMDNNNNNNNNNNNVVSTLMMQQQQQQLARQRRLRLLHFLSTWSRRTIAMARLLLWLSPANNTLFTQSPRLSMALTGLQYTYQQHDAVTDPSSSSSSTPHSFPFHVVYGHRRWLYEEMWRFLAIVAPVTSWHEGQELVTVWIMQPWARTWRQLARRIRSPTPTSAESSSRCPICHLDPIVVPCQTNCGCPQCYCYTCLWQDMYDITNTRMENNPTMNHPTFVCHECQRPFTSVQRWSSSSSSSPITRSSAVKS